MQFDVKHQLLCVLVTAIHCQYFNSIQRQLIISKTQNDRDYKLLAFLVFLFNRMWFILVYSDYVRWENFLIQQ